MPTATNMHKTPSLSGRLVQVDSRKRMTVPSLRSHEYYYVQRSNDGTVVICPPRSMHARGGRMVRVDARKRLTVFEMIPGELYLAHDLEDGSVVLEPAVVIPKRTASAMRARLMNE